MFWDNQVLSCVVKKCGMSDRHSCSTLWILIFFLSLQLILFDYGLFVFISRHATILTASICMRLVPKRIVLQKMRSYLPIQGNFNPYIFQGFLLYTFTIPSVYIDGSFHILDD